MRTTMLWKCWSTVGDVTWQRRTETGRPLLRTWAFAIAVVALVVLLKRTVGGPLGYDAPFLLMLGATVGATWYGGRGAGVVAALVSTAAVTYFFLPPYDSWRSTPGATVQTAVFGAESLLVVGLTSMLVNARRRAEVATGRVRRLHAVSSALARARTPRDVGAAVVREGTAALGATGAGLFLAAEARPCLRLVAQRGMTPALVERLREIPLDSPLPIAAVMSTGKPLAAGTREALRASFPQMFAEPVSWRIPSAMLAVPVATDGRVLGVLTFGFERERELGPDDCALAESLARDAGSALERSRLYESERRVRLEAEEANRAKDEFLGVVSHELRTPLTAIAGWVHLLQRRKADDPQAMARGLEVIARNVKAEARLIEDLLDMSRVISGRLEVQHVAVELRDVVRAVVEELQPAAASRGLELRMRDSSRATVAGDADRLAQVTRNLLGNALKFTPGGGHVTVGVDACGERAVLRVEDDGVGIPAEELPLVFDTFRRSDQTPTRASGLGLGLSIVRGLVAAHGGRIRLESAGRGRGTTAIVDLPRIDGSTPVVGGTIQRELP